jgi:hypothetical protein
VLLTVILQVVNFALPPSLAFARTTFGNRDLTHFFFTWTWTATFGVALSAEQDGLWLTVPYAASLIAADLARVVALEIQRRRVVRCSH